METWVREVDMIMVTQLVMVELDLETSFNSLFFVLSNLGGNSWKLTYFNNWSLLYAFFFTLHIALLAIWNITNQIYQFNVWNVSQETSVLFFLYSHLDWGKVLNLSKLSSSSIMRKAKVPFSSYVLWFYVSWKLMNKLTHGPYVWISLYQCS